MRTAAFKTSFLSPHPPLYIQPNLREKTLNFWEKFWEKKERKERKPTFFCNPTPKILFPTFEILPKPFKYQGKHLTFYLRASLGRSWVDCSSSKSIRSGKFSGLETRPCARRLAQGLLAKNQTLPQARRLAGGRVVQFPVFSPSLFLRFVHSFNVLEERYHPRIKTMILGYI